MTDPAPTTATVSRFRQMLQMLDAFDRIPDDLKSAAMDWARQHGKPAMKFPRRLESGQPIADQAAADRPAQSNLGE